MFDQKKFRMTDSLLYVKTTFEGDELGL